MVVAHYILFSIPLKAIIPFNLQKNLQGKLTGGKNVGWKKQETMPV